MHPTQAPGQFWDPIWAAEDARLSVRWSQDLNPDVAPTHWATCFCTDSDQMLTVMTQKGSEQGEHSQLQNPTE